MIEWFGQHDVPNIATLGFAGLLLLIIGLQQVRFARLNTTFEKMSALCLHAIRIARTYEQKSKEAAEREEGEVTDGI